jgi:hypothetical protein
MLMPSLFYNDFDLFDNVFRGPWFDDRSFKDTEKKLYGHNARNMMSTDVKEKDDSFRLYFLYNCNAVDCLPVQKVRLL